MTTRGPLSSDQTGQCMCRRISANIESFSETHTSIEPQHLVADCTTLEEVLALDQKLSNLHCAMMDCSTCSSDPMRTMALLNELDSLCTLYVAGQAKFATSANPIGNNSNGESVKLGNSMFQLGRYVLDGDEAKVVGRIIVKQGLDHIQKKLQVMQAEERRISDGTMQKEIDMKVKAILSKVWEASAYGCL